MHETIDKQNILLAVIFSALGLVFPVLFHLIGLGSIFLPMYIPLAVGAYFLSKRNALLVGLFTPLVSALITGMPPFYPPVAFMMMAQLAVFCFVISLFTHAFKLNIMAVYIIAITADRIILAAANFIVMPIFSINAKIFTAYDLIKSFPGIILMAIIIPIIVPRVRELIARHSLPVFHDHEKDNHE